MTSLLSHLTELLEESSRGLSGVTKRRMFGCDAFFANGEVYGLIWKTGRIGLKLTESAFYNELMSKPGAAPWTAGAKTMSNWVLVPEDFHDDFEKLTPWVKRAHKLATSGVPTSKSARNAKKVVAKKSVASSTSKTREKSDDKKKTSARSSVTTSSKDGARTKTPRPS